MNSPDERPRRRYLQEYGIPAAIGAAFTTCTEQVVNWLLTSPPYVSWSVAGAGAVAAVLLSRVSEIRRFAEKHLKLVLAVLVALAGFATSFFAGPALVRGDASCPAPTELRLMTAQETVHALRARAEEFVRANRTDDCPAVRISVAAAPPPVQQRIAFERDWERMEDRGGRPYARLYGLQPDAWVTASSAESDRLREVGIHAVADGASAPLVGQDRLVLAMSETRLGELHAIMSDPSGQPLSKVVETLRTELNMTVARPFPETSISALIATGDLFRALGLTDEEDMKQEEEKLVTDGLGAVTVGSLLCAFDRISAPGGPKVAMIVPLHSVEDYNSGRLADCPGARRSERLAAVRHNEFSALDHRYVRVTWRGQTSPQKQQLVDAFGAWLARHPLFGDAQAIGSRQADAASLTALQARLLDRLRPELHLRVLIDTSGSAARLLRLQAAEALHDQRMFLGPRDRVEVHGLSSVREGGLARLTKIAGWSTHEQLGTVAQRVEDAGFDGWDAPVSAGIRDLDDESSSLDTPVLLLTDGRLFDNERGEPEAAIRDALRDTKDVPGLYVIVFGPNGCAVAHLEDQDLPYRCVRAGGQASETLTQAIMTMRGWR